MFKFIAVCVLVMGLTIQQCDKGCLKCNTKNECVFCDTTNNYYLSGTKCLTSTLTNCLILNLNGDCGQCASNYYLDASTKKCVAVETSKQVANCQYYGTAQACIRCVKGYFIKDGKCVAVVKTIDNCEVYSDDGKCAGCASGYLFNAARDGCVASPNVNGCSSYSFLDCKTCSTGYIANQNLYFVDYQSNALNVQNEIIRFVTGSFNDWTSLKRCQKIQDSNCLVASAYNVCTTCAAGYFLTNEKACRAYPKPIIEACQTYNSLTTCSGCLSGYYLESSTKCTLIAGDKLITDCVTYDNKANTVRCTQCTAAKYLNSNACVARVDSTNIINCKATNPNADECLTCNDNFQLTGDNKKCLAAIANCATYVASTTNTLSHACSACKPKYYLNSDANGATTCIAGGLAGCLVYTSSTACSACDTTAYYLTSGTCTLHPKVDNCADYDGSNFGTCNKCNTGFYPFKLSFTCESFTPIVPFCIEYSGDTNKCTTCATGYFLKNDNTCVNYSTLTNCKTANSAGVCTACIDKYALKTDNTCIANHDFILTNCDVVAASAVFKLSNEEASSQCTTCKENTYPFDLSDYFGCVSTSILAVKGVSAVVDGCKRYSNDATPLCLQCTGTSYLRIASPRTCVTTCDATYTNLLEDFQSGATNVCNLQSDGTYGLTGCLVAIKVWDHSIGTPAPALRCIKAIDANILFMTYTEIALADNAGIWRDISDSSVVQNTDSFLYNGFVLAPIVDDTNNIHEKTASGDLTVSDVKCEIYAKDAANKYRCWRCKWGMTAVWKATPKSQCVRFTGCNQATKYGGFSSFLNTILSCHGCTTAGEDLVVSFNNAALTPAGTIVLANSVDDVNFLRCITPATTGTHTVSAPRKIDNCHVYALVYLADTFDAASSGCIACKPGYKLNGANPISATCDAISDCDTSKTAMVNRCTACSQVGAAGAVQYRAFDSNKFQGCQKTHADNCLIVGAQDGSTGIYFCATCKPGYYLNQDKRCDKITLPSCADTAGSTFYKFPGTITQESVINYSILKSLSKQTTIQGCDNCNAGYTAFKLFTGERQCVGSSYVQNNGYASVTGTKYIVDCAKYNNVLDTSATPNSTCAACKNNKIPTLNGKSCVAAPSTACKVAQNTDTTKCQTCADTHVPVLGTCTLKNIQNCATYDITPTVASVICIACSNGFVLASDGKSCTAGKVFACNTYSTNQPFICTACQTGYSLISTNSNNKTYCVKINDGSNCRTLNNGSSGLQGKLYKCDSCVSTNSAAFIPKVWASADSTKSQSVCLALNLVEKCISYDVASSTVNGNTFLCTACSTGFFLNEDTNTCVTRVNQPSGCIEYEINKDKCKVCSASTFINADSTDCVSFPNGILGCATYSNDTVCTSCDSPRYLNNNTCSLSTVINKCIKYSSNNTCTSCESGYFLTNSTFCEQAKAANCYTFANINTCDKCDPNDNNKGLKTDANSVTSCVDKNVANCEISTSTFPFTCTQCKKGFYLGTDGNCAAATPIAKCLAYDSASTCTKCEALSVLAVDRKSCNDTAFAAYIDSNCVETSQLSTPACSKCNPGSFFASGACTSCTNNTFANGCFSCDPNNQTSCFACRPGYYQTQNGNCLSVNSQTNVTNGTGSSAVIAKLFGFVAFLFALLF